MLVIVITMSRGFVFVACRTCRICNCSLAMHASSYVTATDVIYYLIYIIPSAHTHTTHRHSEEGADCFDLCTCLNHLSLLCVCMEVLGYLNFFYMKLTVAIENFDVAIGACWK